MPLIFEKREGIACITMARPEVHNAWDTEMRQQLGEAWLRVRDDDDIQVAIITGAGDRAFTAGGDTKKRLPQVVGAQRTSWDAGLLHTLKGANLWKPVIAAVNGYCYGGNFELLSATDIRIASEHAIFAASEVRIGMFPFGGITVHLPRQIPYCLAMEALLTGGQGGGITARQALRMGILNRVVPPEQLMPTAFEYARKIMGNDPAVVQAIKRVALLTSGRDLEASFLVEMANYNAVTDNSGPGRRSQEPEEIS